MPVAKKIALLLFLVAFLKPCKGHVRATVWETSATNRSTLALFPSTLTPVQAVHTLAGEYAQVKIKIRIKAGEIPDFALSDTYQPKLISEAFTSISTDLEEPVFDYSGHAQLLRGPPRNRLPAFMR